MCQFSCMGNHRFNIVAEILEEISHQKGKGVSSLLNFIHYGQFHISYSTNHFKVYRKEILYFQNQ